MDNAPKPSRRKNTDKEFLSKIEILSKFKERSYQTYHNIHLPELNYRLNLDLNLPYIPKPNTDDNPFASQPDLLNDSRIEVVYLGNSMLERFKTTGRNTNLGKFHTAWNAGCGGDKTENVLYRLSQGMYITLKRAQEDPVSNCDIKLWILASGTNNLRPKRPFGASDLASYRLLLETCLRLAPRSRVLACDMSFRKDIPDAIVEDSNRMVRSVVDEVNRELVETAGEERVVWVQSASMIGKDMLVDHVHLNEEGYGKWDDILWPHVVKVLPDLK